MTLEQYEQWLAAHDPNEIVDLLNLDSEMLIQILADQIYQAWFEEHGDSTQED